MYRFIVTQVQCIPVMLFYFILVTICFESTDSVCIIKSLDISPVLHHLHVYNTITHSVTIIMQRPYIRCWDEAVDNLMLTYVLWVMLRCVFIIPMWIWSYRPVWCLRRPVIRHFRVIFFALWVTGSVWKVRLWLFVAYVKAFPLEMDCRQCGHKGCIVLWCVQNGVFWDAVHRCHQNATRFQGARVGVISFINTRKIRPSVNLFSWNS